MVTHRYERCSRCRNVRRFRRRHPDHPFHLRLAVCTAGAWCVVWVPLWIASLRNPWRCTHCRHRLDRPAPAHHRVDDEQPAGFDEIVSAPP